MKTSAAIYTRISTDKQDARSLVDQRRRCDAYATAHGLHVADHYSDEAISGAHTAREGLQKLLSDAARRRFGAVLIDDLSRLSRDLGDTWTMVFTTFAALDVVVTDVMTGMASNAPGARMLYGAMGLVADGQRQTICAETHRGLEGRSLAGFHTGGRTFGFTTRPEENPPDPEHVRMVSIIDEAEATIVRRVFHAFADGQSLQVIADGLNTDGIAAPHDGGKGNKGVRGWSHTTIRAIVRNERYVGRVVWNTSRWVRAGSKRRRIARPESEWIRRDVPELAIIDPVLWAQVQARIKRQPTGRRRPSGTGQRQGSLFSGLLRCGVCGGAFGIVARKEKAGRAYASLGCSVSRSRGKSVCANRSTIDERRLRDHVRAELQSLSDHPDALAEFADAYSQRMSALQKQENTGALDRELRAARRKLEHVADLLTEPDMRHSPTMRRKYGEIEARVRELEARIGETRKRVVVPHPAAVSAWLRDLIGLMGQATPQARESLARFLPSPLRLVPTAAGYTVEGVLIAPAASSAAGVLSKSSSGGLLLDYSETSWIPMEFTTSARSAV